LWSYEDRFSGETANLELLRDGKVTKVVTTLKTPVRLVLHPYTIYLHHTQGYHIEVLFTEFSKCEDWAVVLKKGRTNWTTLVFVCSIVT
jgi:hypothetical protein